MDLKIFPGQYHQNVSIVCCQLFNDQRFPYGDSMFEMIILKCWQNFSVLKLVKRSTVWQLSLAFVQKIVHGFGLMWYSNTSRQLTMVARSLKQIGHYYASYRLRLFYTRI